jgi:N6-L-threonylcarbamoyladenine synthase
VPFDFSFSGLKTSVLRAVELTPSAKTEDLCASFQRAVTDVLVAKTMAAVRATGARGVALAGGVAANSELRERLAAACAGEGVPVALASRDFCTDNAAMVALAGSIAYDTSGASAFTLGPDPSLSLAP